MERSRRDGSRFAVGLIDLDGFKPVNDVHGHATGDRVLIEAGRRLRQVSGPAVCLARLGGDEFGLIIDGNPPDADIRRRGQEFCDVLQAYVLPDLTAQVSCRRSPVRISVIRAAPFRFGKPSTKNLDLRTGSGGSAV